MSQANSQTAADVAGYGRVSSAIRIGAWFGSDPLSAVAGTGACKVGAADEMEAYFVAIDDDG